MPTYVPVMALRQTESVDGVTINTGDVQYITRAQLEDLANSDHIVVCGAPCNSNVDVVVFSGGVVTTHSAELKVDSTVGELRNRETGAYSTLAAGSAVALKTADATQDRTSLVVAKNSNGVVSVVDGVLAAAGTSVAPACPEGSTPLAEVLVKATATAPSTITDVRPRQ